MKNSSAGHFPGTPIGGHRGDITEVDSSEAATRRRAPHGRILEVEDLAVLPNIVVPLVHRSDCVAAMSVHSFRSGEIQSSSDSRCDIAAETFAIT